MGVTPIAPDEQRNVLGRFCRAWEQQDLPGALEVIHDDVLYAISIPPEVVLFGGETRGRVAMADRMSMKLDQFEVRRFITISNWRNDDVEYGRVAYSFSHRVTGETISGVMRLVAIVEDGMIVDLQEFHDVDKIRAFMRLIAYKAAENAPDDR